MGLFDFFRKKSKNVNIDKEQTNLDANSSEVSTVNSEMIKTILKEVEELTKRPLINIHVHDGKTSLTESKFGGIPYIPADGHTPADNSDRQLRLLAQINLEELPENNFMPPKGILQFWILDDDCAGLEFDKLNSNNTSRVTYYENIDLSVTEEQVLNKYSPYIENDGYFPVKAECKLSFTLSEEGVSTCSYFFEKLFTETWNQKYPQNKIKSLAELPEDEDEDIFGDMSGFGHKIGGYPAFTQEDPRSGDNYLKDYDILLLQIDSAGTAANEIMWGDSGIGSFFIAESDLKNKDFSKTAYTWDCY